MLDLNGSTAPLQLPREMFSQDLVDRVLESLPSANSRRNYKRSIEDLLLFAGRRPVTLDLLLKWRTAMAKNLTPATVNVRIAAARKLFREAHAEKHITADQLTDFQRLERLRQLGSVTGNWLTREQSRALLGVPNRKTLRGKRAYCVLAILLGCALRRNELAELTLDQVQMREGRWVIANLRGKGGRLRTVAVPAWVKEAIDSWTKASSITAGLLVRRLNSESVLSNNAIYGIVNGAAVKIGVPKFGPHDLRRTCAKLCRSRGGRIESIQAMLGHTSIATTERYLGSTEDLRHAVNDDLGIWA